MTDHYTGGCTCGQVRYEVAGTPVAMNICQCRQCQRDSGTGHAALVTFWGAEATLTGEPNRWPATGDGGTRKEKSFCPTCGAPVALTSPDMPELFVVTAASLDDPTLFAPERVMWTEARQPWDRTDTALPSFERMPPQ